MRPVRYLLKPGLTEQMLNPCKSCSGFNPALAALVTCVQYGFNKPLELCSLRELLQPEPGVHTS